MSIQHMVSSIDDLISYTDGKGRFYKIDFRIKVIWLLLTLLTAILCVDMIFTFWLLVCTLILERAGGSPVFQKIRKNKALVTFVFGMIVFTFLFGALNRAMVTSAITPEILFFYLARSTALGFIAISLGTLFMSILQTSRVIEMTAGRGPTTSILTFLTFRSIPLVAYHLNNVIDSQRARGLEMEKLGPLSIIKGIKAIFIPLLILLTGSIDRTSKVLEARGINPGVKNKSSYVKSKLAGVDYLLLFYMAFQLILSLWITSQYYPDNHLTTLTYTLFSNWGLI